MRVDLSDTKGFAEDNPLLAGVSGLKSIPKPTTDFHLQFLAVGLVPEAAGHPTAFDDGRVPVDLYVIRVEIKIEREPGFGIHNYRLPIAEPSDKRLAVERRTFLPSIDARVPTT